MPNEITNEEIVLEHSIKKVSQVLKKFHLSIMKTLKY